MHAWLKRIIASNCLVAALASAACTPITVTPATPASAPALNIVDEAGLRDAVAIEILEFTPAAATQYTVRTTVTAPDAMGEITAFPDQETPLGPAPACIALYRLRFVMAGDEVRTFDLACDETTGVLFGDDLLVRDRSVQFDTALIQLLNAHLP